MRFTAVAVAAGLVVGVLLGGRLRHLGERPFRLWPFLALGIALQLPLLDPLGFAGLLISYACLLTFALANIHLVGMALVALGIVLNAAVIAANAGMPVHRGAIVAAGIVPRGEVDTVHPDRKHHLQDGDDRLTPLADIIPVRPLREVVSFGDVVMAVGVADVLAHLLRRPKAKRLRRPPDPTRRGSRGGPESVRGPGESSGPGPADPADRLAGGGTG